MSPELIELAKAAAALPGWEWRRGMWIQTEEDGDCVWAPFTPCDPPWMTLDCSDRGPGDDDVLDLTDPATGGALLGLLGPGVTTDRPSAWRVVVREGGHVVAAERGATLGEACARAALALGRWPGGAP